MLTLKKEHMNIALKLINKIYINVDELKYKVCFLTISSFKK